MRIKSIIRALLIFFHIDLSKNLEYDRLTHQIIKDNLDTHSNCIDVGCHKGEILHLMLKYAKQGKHYAFEPLPHLYQDLKKNFSDKATILPYALSDKNGASSFQFVKNAPAYSGIKKRQYNVSEPDIEEIQVELKMLDNLIPADEKIHLIKIDVEGGEFAVLKGANDVLKRNKPIIIFECGKGASDFYGTDPTDIFLFISENIGMDIYLLKNFIKKKSALTKEEFVEHFNKNKEYYFVASARS